MFRCLVLAGAAALLALLLHVAISGSAPDAAGPLSQKAAMRIAETDTTTAEVLGWKVPLLRRVKAARGVSNFGILCMSDKERARALYKTDHPKDVGAPGGIKWRALATLDENGNPPPANALQVAQAQCQALPAPAGGAFAPAAGLEPTNWTEHGPGNWGGRIRGLVVHPTSTNTMFAGSVGGGLFRTDNGGASWAPVDDFLPTLAITSIVFDPTNTMVMYAATGEGFGNGDQIRGAGIFKSTDGGVTWTQLAGTANSNFFWTNRVTISSDGSALLAATLSGIYRNTADGVGTWDLEQAGSFGDVDFDPNDSMQAIASPIQAGSSTTQWSNDGGQTWTASTGLGANVDRVETAWSESVADVVYAITVQVVANVFSTGGVYRSTDGGQTFSPQNTVTNLTGGIGWYTNVIQVMPFDADGNANDEVLFVGGVVLWRSQDFGVTWTQISSGNGTTSAHADNHVIVAHPNFDGTDAGNARVFFGTDGGVFEATDCIDVGTNAGRGDTTQSLNAGWVNLNNSLSVCQFYAGATHPTNETFIGGTQDNGTLMDDNATGLNAWPKVFGNDGAYCSIEQTDFNYQYVGSQNLRVYRSTTGGGAGSYTTIDTDITDNAASPVQANFIAPTLLDPNDPNTFLAGGWSLWRSTNVKTALPANVAFSAIKPALTAGEEPTPRNRRISAMDIAVGNSDVIWVAHNNGHVYSTTDGTAVNPVWTRQDTNTPALPNRFVTEITIDPDDEMRVLVSFGGFNSDNVWQTKDGGTTWTQAMGMPAMPVRDIQIHPTNKTWLYAGTELGILASQNDGQTWSMVNEGPANVSIDDLLWIDNVLYAATHGRGLWSQQTADPADVTPPTLACAVARRFLWPPIQGLFSIGFSLTVMDDMDPDPDVLVDIYSTEAHGPAPFAPDAVGTSAAMTRLRAERMYPSPSVPPGRIYLVSVSAADEGANVTYQCHFSLVPTVPTGMNLMMLNMQAMTDAAFVVANDGLAPAGYTLLLSYEEP